MRGRTPAQWYLVNQAYKRGDVLGLIEEHMPELSDGYPEWRSTMAVGPQHDRPAIRSKN